MNNMERFTQRARRVLTLAEEAAAQLKHSVIGTEHVLLGLLQEEHGVASRVLRDLALEHKRVVELIVELTPKVESFPVSAAPELSPETKRLLELTVAEARTLDQHYIGTEHLLLGLVQQEESMAVRILKRFDISPEQVRQQTQQVLQEPPPIMITTEVSEQASIESRTSPPSPLSVYIEGEQEPEIGGGKINSPTVLKNQPEPPSAAAPPDMLMAIVTKVLEMVSQNKLTTIQGSELLGAFQVDMTLTPAGKARFASMVNRAGVNLKRRVRVTIYDSDTKLPKFEIANSLDDMLNFIDHFLRLVADNDFESLVLDGDSSPIATEIRIEKDEPSA